MPCAGTPFGLVDVALLAATRASSASLATAAVIPLEKRAGPEAHADRPAHPDGIPDATAMVGPSGEILL